jgi:septal ring factor EnvC (AmiA/AmiB activator)
VRTPTPQGKKAVEELGIRIKRLEGELTDAEEKTAKVVAEREDAEAARKGAEQQKQVHVGKCVACKCSCAGVCVSV